MHEALGALLTTVTVTTDLQSTVVGKYLQLKAKPERYPLIQHSNTELQVTSILK